MTDEKCLFCRIVTGEVPARVVYVDPNAIAFGGVPAGIINPHIFGGTAFRAEHDVGFYALTVRRERASRQSQDR